MIKWLIGRWHKRLRSIDIDILWPSCRDGAPDLVTARAAFTIHACHDHAWSNLSNDEINRIIDGLS